MSYADADVAAAVARMDKYRSGPDYEVGAALAVVGLSAERADKEIAIRDDMIRTAHRAGASLRQIAEAAGLGRKTVTGIVEADPLALTSEREELADPLDSLVGGEDV